MEKDQSARIVLLLGRWSWVTDAVVDWHLIEKAHGAVPEQVVLGGIRYGAE